MRRTLQIWVPIAAIYVVFLYWHLPHQPPLDPTEWRMKVAAANLPSQKLPPAFAAFLDSDDGRPFFMINLNNTAETAQYPPNLPSQTDDAAEAARLYGRAVLPQLLARGSYPMLITEPMATLIQMPPGAKNTIDDVAIVRYRSRRDMLDMMLNPDFQAALVHKWASLDGALVMPATRRMAVVPGVWVPLALLSLGLTLTIARRR